MNNQQSLVKMDSKGKTLPRNVRNFWLEGRVDGRQSRIRTGPVSAGGGFELRVSIRDGGIIHGAVYLSGDASPDGSLTLRIGGPDGEILGTVRAHRTVRGVTLTTPDR